FVFGVGAHGVDQRLRGEDVVAHGGVDLVGVVGQPHGVVRLFYELGDAVVTARHDHTEARSFVERDANRSHGDATARLDVRVDHLLRVHPVDVIRAEDTDVVGCFVADQVQ